MFDTILLKLACFRFRFLRGQFYYDLSRTMAVVSDGANGKNLLDLLETQAQRHKHNATGKVCAVWVDRLKNEVSSFSEAITGTVPDEDQILLEVCEESGDLSFGLEALGKNLLALNETLSNIVSVMTLVMVMIVITLAYTFAQTFHLLPEMFASMKASIDLSKLGETTDSVISFMEFWQAWGWLVVVGIITLIGCVWISLSKLTGDMRKVLDKWFLPYQLYRAFHGALFLSTISVITQKLGGNRVMALSEALNRINKKSYPWLKWQSMMIIENLDNKPNSGGEIFNTGIMEQRAYYRVLDMGDYTLDTAELMHKVTQIILEETPVYTMKKVKRWRGVLQLVVVGVILAFYFASGGVNSEFQIAIETSNIQ